MHVFFVVFLLFVFLLFFLFVCFFLLACYKLGLVTEGARSQVALLKDFGCFLQV